MTGRDDVLSHADVALQRIPMGRHAKSQILLGLRGTGKTVLLNRIENLAETCNHVTAFIEAPEDRRLPQLLYPELYAALRKFSAIEHARQAAHTAMRGLRSFASVFRINAGDMSLSVDPLPGTADSGSLEHDLTDLFLGVGAAARDAGTAWTLLIDEVQYLRMEELSALITALHRANQRGLPVIFFGGGLPQTAALAGNAKSYAERLFDFPSIGALETAAAKAAVEGPIREEGESITDDALDAIIEATEGYPYFLQEWGYQAWNAADAGPISADDVTAATQEASRRLDEGFFRVRFDRLTPKERDYVLTMAAMGPGPYRSSDVAERMKESLQSLGPCRANIIKKGMIYSPNHGDIAFTVPMFDQFIQRNFPAPGG
ncbi:MAG: ATP-binding protein [Rhodospirillales bacterium]